MERIRTTLVYVLLTLVTAVALFPIGYMLLIAGGEGERFAEGGQTLFPETAGEMPGNLASNLDTEFAIAVLVLNERNGIKYSSVLNKSGRVSALTPATFARALTLKFVKCLIVDKDDEVFVVEMMDGTTTSRTLRLTHEFAFKMATQNDNRTSMSQAQTRRKRRISECEDKLNTALAYAS